MVWWGFHLVAMGIFRLPEGFFCFIEMHKHTASYLSFHHLEKSSCTFSQENYCQESGGGVFWASEELSLLKAKAGREQGKLSPLSPLLSWRSEDRLGLCLGGCRSQRRGMKHPKQGLQGQVQEGKSAGWGFSNTMDLLPVFNWYDATRWRYQDQ